MIGAAKAEINDSSGLRCTTNDHFGQWLSAVLISPRNRHCP
jgi:hypothetical protein